MSRGPPQLANGYGTAYPRPPNPKMIGNYGPVAPQMQAPVFVA